MQETPQKRKIKKLWNPKHNIQPNLFRTSIVYFMY